MPRQTARAVIVRGSSVLLLHHQRIDGTSFWATPGGGLQEGESFRDAAEREAREETNLAVTLGPCLWVRRKEVRSGGSLHTMDIRYYFATCDGQEPRLVDAEMSASLIGVGWWTPQQLVATTEAIEPPGLGELLDAFIQNGPPSPPIDLGLTVLP